MVTGLHMAVRRGRRLACYVRLVLALCGLALLSQPGLADQPLTLHLVTGPDYKPYTDPGLPQGGMQSEIVRAAFAKVGDQVEITFEPWARGYAETEHLAFDGTFPYVHAPDREKDFLYSDPSFVLAGRAWVTPDNQASIASAAELAGKALCLPNGYVLPDTIQGMLSGGELRLERAAGMEQCFKMLQMKRVDFVVCSEIQARATSQRLWNTVEGVKTLPFVLTQSTHSLIVPRQHPQAARIIADFNRGLAMLKESGELDAIIKRHLDAYYQQVSN